MEALASTNQIIPDSNSSQDRGSQSSIIDSSWDTKSHAEKAAFLESTYTIEKTDVASGIIESEAYKTEDRSPVSKIARKLKFHKKPIRQVSEDYLQIIRAHFTKLILQSIRNVQPYAGTPNASVYVHKILHTIRDFEDKSPDDPILEVLFAFYDALAYQHQWTTYTSTQFEKAEEILNQITKESIKSKDIEKAVAALDNVGFDTIPFQFSLEDDAL